LVSLNQLAETVAAEIRQAFEVGQNRLPRVLAFNLHRVPSARMQRGKLVESVRAVNQMVVCGSLAPASIKRARNGTQRNFEQTKFADIPRELRWAIAATACASQSAAQVMVQLLALPAKV
jgi:hypothetical protein